MTRTVSQINVFMRFTQKFEMVVKNGGKTIRAKKWQMIFIYTGGKKFRYNCSMLHHFRDKCILVFYAETQDSYQKWRENDFWQKVPYNFAYTGWAKNFVGIALSQIVSDILKIFHFDHQEKLWRLVNH